MIVSHNLASSERQPKLGPSRVMTALSDVYAGLQRAAGGALSARAWPFMELKRGNGLGCCVVG